MNWPVAALLALAIAQAIQGVLLLVLLRQVGILGMRVRPAGAKQTLSGPAIGQPVPPLSLPDSGNSGLMLELPAADGRAWLVFFVAPGCSSCQLIAPAVRSLSAETADELGWGVICMGRRSDCVRFGAERSFGRSLFCYASDDIRDVYEIGTTPYALLIGADGNLISKGLVNHIEHLENMIEAAREGRAERSLTS
jgi:methylamine dehydrogenase accessory protein MauD